MFERAQNCEDRYQDQPFVAPTEEGIDRQAMTTFLVSVVNSCGVLRSGGNISCCRTGDSMSGMSRSKCLLEQSDERGGTQLDLISRYINDVQELVGRKETSMIDRALKSDIAIGYSNVAGTLSRDGYLSRRVAGYHRITELDR